MSGRHDRFANTSETSEGAANERCSQRAAGATRIAALFGHSACSLRAPPPRATEALPASPSARANSRAWTIGSLRCSRRTDASPLDGSRSTGARGEAASGFPHVVGVALPALYAGQALPDVFLRLVATVDDTCVLHRGGSEARTIAQRGARTALRAGGCKTAQGRSSIRALERALIARNASPGGCADLLAAAVFLRDLTE